MADIKTARPQRTNTDLSDAESRHSDVETLNEEELPSYQDQPGSSTQPFPEKSAPASASVLSPGSATGTSTDTRTGTRPPTAGPTTSAPFNFPTTGLPSYEAAIDFQKPLAIPQCSPTPDAPFVSVYPTDLLSYGVPAESWYSFVDTLSAFLSAKVSQQAVHHAADVAKSLQDRQKRYVTHVKRSFRDMGKSAKHFNPFGVVGGVLDVTFGTVGHAVGSIVSTPFTLIQKPKTPRERATVYIAAANKDWFHRRGLHALLLDTAELSSVLGVSHRDVLSAAQRQDSSDVVGQLTALRQWIGDVQSREVQTTQDDGERSTVSLQPEAISSRLTSVSSRQSKGKANAINTSQLQLGTQTLWLVITQEKNVETVEVDEKPH